MSSREPEDRGFRKIVPLARVQLLTDALFALSMMVILLQVEYPDPELVVTDDQIREFFSEQVLALEVFAITFILIAIYWVKHMEQFGYIREMDYRLLWLQLGYLLFLVLLPVLNAYAVLYPLNGLVFVSYCAVLVGMGFFSAASWRYASKGHRLLNQEVEPEVVVRLWQDALIEPFTAAAAILVALWSVEAGQAALLVIPLAFGIQRWQRKRRARGSETA
ncbi:MAG: TMEM175 family protein [Polyangiales bacterium]